MPIGPVYRGACGISLSTVSSQPNSLVYTFCIGGYLPTNDRTEDGVALLWLARELARLFGYQGC